MALSGPLLAQIWPFCFGFGPGPVSRGARAALEVSGPGPQASDPYGPQAYWG